MFRNNIIAEMRRVVGAYSYKQFVVKIVPGAVDIDIFRSLIESIDGEVGEAVRAYCVLDSGSSEARRCIQVSSGILDADNMRTSDSLAALAQAVELIYGEEATPEGVLVPISVANARY